MSPPPPSGRGIISVFRRTVKQSVCFLLYAPRDSNPEHSD